MAYRRPWWRYITEVFVRTKGRCVTVTNSDGSIGCGQRRHSWLWGSKDVDCGDDCLP